MGSGSIIILYYYVVEGAMDRKPFARAIQSRLPLLVFILCMIQPVMDVLSYWLDVAGADNTITLLLRLLVLVATVLAGFVLSRRKWIYFLLCGVLILLAAGHAAVCLYYGYQDPVGDLTNQVRIYQMPLTVLAFITFFRRDEKCLNAVKWGFLGSFGVMVVVELLATITQTDPHTYANKGIGVLGWFLTTSAQSAILSMVIPVAILCVLEWKQHHPLFSAGIGVLGLGVLYLFATRLTYAALLGCAFGLAASCLLIKVLHKKPYGKTAAVFAALGIVAVLLTGLSPMAANNEKVAENAALKQEDILQLVAQDRAAAEAEGLTGTELETAALKSAYEKYLPGVTGRFGLERTAEYYGYTTDVVNLSNTRLQKQSYSLMLLQDQPLARVFGLELHDLTYDDVTYDAENDFHGIYFLCGGVGLALMIAFIGFFLLRIAVVLVKDFKAYFTLPAAAFGIALICGLAHAYFTAGVLRRPNSNFYLGVLLAAVYVLSAAGGTKRDTEERHMMIETKQLRNCVTERLPLLVLILFILQPLMDVLSFWVAKWQMSNMLTLALRMLVLAVMVAAGFWLSHRKKVYIIAAAICAFIGLGHMIASWQFGYQNIVSDLSNYIRVLQLPLTVLCLITFIRGNEGCYDAIKKGIALNLTIILAVQVLAIVTGTEPHTYDDGRGLIGWFANTNTQSAIVTMAGPAAAAWLYQRKGLKSVWFWITLIGSGISMFYLGTRLAYLGIVAMCFGLAVSMIIVRIKDWKKAVVLMVVGALFVALVDFSPMMGHRGDWDNQMGDKQGWMDVMTQEPGEIPEEPVEPDDSVPLYDAELVESLSEEQLEKIYQLAPAYEHFVSDFVSIFGVEKTVVLFNYTEDITAMTDLRAKKLLVAKELMDMSPLMVKLFGVELDWFTIKGNIYDVENDFHGIYYLYGVVGLAAMLLFLLWFLLMIVKYLIKNFKRYFTLDAAGWGIALVMALVHCYFTASILRRPSASFYMAAVLAGVYYLLKMKHYSEDIKE